MADSITIPIDVSLPKYKVHVNKLFKNVKYMHKYLPGKKAAAKTFENGVVFFIFHLIMEMSGFNGILELLSFGVINGIPAYMIVKNRGLTHEHSVRSGLIGFGMYSTLYVGLQLGGFWIPFIWITRKCNLNNIF